MRRLFVSVAALLALTVSAAKAEIITLNARAGGACYSWGDCNNREIGYQRDVAAGGYDTFRNWFYFDYSAYGDRKIVAATLQLNQDRLDPLDQRPRSELPYNVYMLPDLWVPSLVEWEYISQGLLVSSKPENQIGSLERAMYVDFDISAAGVDLLNNMPEDTIMMGGVLTSFRDYYLFAGTGWPQPRLQLTFEDEAQVPNPTDLPEPASLALLGIGALAFLARRRAA